MLLSAVFVALGLVVATWIYNNVILVLPRLYATRNIPDPDVGHWLLGHIPALLAKPMTSFRCFHEWAKQYGPIYRVRFFWRPVLVVTDPDLYQPLLRPGPAKLQKYTPPYKMFEVFMKPPRSNMISSSETSTWKSVRRAAVAALTMNNLRLAFPHITAVTQRLIDSLAAAGPDAVQDMDLAAQQVTVDVIGLAAFDRDLRATCREQAAAGTAAASAVAASEDTAADSAKAMASAAGTESQQQAPPVVGSMAASGGGIAGRGPEVLEVIRHLVVAMQSRNNPLNRWFPWRKAHRDLMYWGGRMSGIVLDLLADMQANPPPPHTLGSHLMACRHQDTGEPLDNIQIGTELGLMWGAGFETTGHTICWTLFLVATHPEVEAALTAELASLGLLATREQPQPQQMKWEHLAQLRYLSAVLNESMRLFPVASSGTIRVTHAPINLAGHRIPAGQPILFPMFAIHRSPALWEDPDSFKPERWLHEDARTAAAAAAAGGKRAAAAQPACADDAGGDADTAQGHTAAEEAEAAVDGVDSDDYVHVTADVDNGRDQQAKLQKRMQQAAGAGTSKGTGQQQLGSASSSKPSSSGLELKDPTVNRRGFMPFSEGSRNCVGQALALVELKAVLAMLLGHFRFRLAPEMGGYAGVEADARQAITLSPQHGLLMSAKHRSLL